MRGCGKQIRWYLLVVALYGLLTDFRLPAPSLTYLKVFFLSLRGAAHENVPNERYLPESSRIPQLTVTAFNASDFISWASSTISGNFVTAEKIEHAMVHSDPLISKTLDIRHNDQVQSDTHAMVCAGIFPISNLTKMRK